MQKHFPLAYKLFMKIAEPRVHRILQFGIYLFLLEAGLGVIWNAPNSFYHVIGDTLVYIFGMFLMLGSIIGAVAVLPGIWWLERVGVILVTTGILMFLVIAIALHASTVTVAVTVIFILNFIQRWFEIRGAPLAPSKE